MLLNISPLVLSLVQKTPDDLLCFSRKAVYLLIIINISCVLETIMRVMCYHLTCLSFVSARLVDAQYLEWRDSGNLALNSSLLCVLTSLPALIVYLQYPIHVIPHCVNGKLTNNCREITVTNRAADIALFKRNASSNLRQVSPNRFMKQY